MKLPTNICPTCGQYRNSREPKITPFQAGYIAAILEHSSSSCPYPKGSSEWNRWMSGYNEGYEDRTHAD